MKMDSRVSDFNAEEVARQENALTTEKVLGKTIPWEKLAQSKVVEQKELSLLRRYDKIPANEKGRLLDEDGPQYAEVFMGLIVKLASDEYLQYVLALVDELLSAADSRVALFVQLGQINESLPFEPLFHLLNRKKEDVYIVASASKILATLLLRGARYGAHPARMADYAKNLFKWLSYNLQNPDAQPERAQALLASVRTLLRNQEYRLVVDAQDGTNLLASLLRSQQHQTVYQAMYCLWLLSYNEHLAKRRFPQTTVSAKIVETVKNMQREKIVRISIATLRNLADHSRENSLQMVEAGFMKVLPNLLMRKWGDDELETNLQKLNEVLQDIMAELGSWEKYKAEVLSGTLEWTMVHKSDRFWRENATRFSENNYQVAGVLIDIVTNSQNVQNLAVALHDIGQFVRYHPAGRNIVSAIPQAKISIMERLNHPDPEVQKHALLCIQKVMVSNWEYLSSSSTGN